MKNYRNQIFEASTGKPTSKQSIETACKKIFMAEKAKEHLNIPLELPQSFFSIVAPMKNAPKDLKALMQDLSQTEMETFKNVDGVLPDPTTTYEYAQDYALDAFQDLPEKLKLISPKNSSSATNESCMPLNEFDAAGAAETFAEGSADLGFNIFSGVAKGIGSVAAVPAAAALGAGMIAGANTDAVPGSYVDNSKLDSRQDSIKTEQKGDKDAKYKGDSAIEAIEQYVESIVNSVGAFAHQFGGNTEEVNNFKKQIRLLIKHNDENGDYYKDMSDDLLKAIKSNKEKDDKNVLLNDKHKQNVVYALLKIYGKANCASSTDENIKNLYKKIDSIKDPSDAIHVKSALEEYLKSKGDNDLLGELANIDVMSFTKSESAAYSNNNKLFEAEVPEDIKKIDGEDQYISNKAFIQNLCTKLLPKSGKDLPGYDAAKQRMDALTTAANEEITRAINVICKVSEGNQADMGSAISRFLSKHPLKANGLLGVWSEYYSELNGRKDKRLRSMENITSPQFSQGWACNIVENAVPEILAKMLTYHYVLKILKNKNVYSYTSLQRNAEEKEWEEVKGQEIKKKVLPVAIALQANGTKLVANPTATEAISITESGIAINSKLNCLGYYLHTMGATDLQSIITSANNGQGDEFLTKMYTLYSTNPVLLKGANSAVINKISKTFEAPTYDPSAMIDCYAAISKEPLSDNQKVFLQIFKKANDSNDIDALCVSVLNDRDEIKDALDASTDKPVIDLNPDADDYFITLNDIREAIIPNVYDNVYDNLKKMFECARDNSGDIDDVIDDIQKENAELEDFEVADKLIDLTHAYLEAFYNPAGHSFDQLQNYYGAENLLGNVELEALTDPSTNVTVCNALDGVAINQGIWNSSITPAVSCPSFKDLRSKRDIVDFIKANASHKSENIKYVDELSDDLKKVLGDIYDSSTGPSNTLKLNKTILQTNWPDLYDTAFLAIEMLKVIDDMQESGTLAGAGVDAIKKIEDNIKDCINKINKATGIDGIMQAIAEASDYNAIIKDPKYTNKLQSIANIFSNSDFKDLQAIVNNLRSVFNI